jgi:A/G-specific adenine glycosylase
LPGIGRSTAGAILSIAFQQAATILDGNVKRVFARFLNIAEWPGEKSVLETLWKTAEYFTPKKRVADYSQAMMDLGAMVCVRGKPLCEICPLEKICEARRLGLEKQLPKSKPKKILPVKQTTFLIMQHEKSILLQKRPPAGIWGGLWSLPEIAEFNNEINIRKNCLKHFNIKPHQITSGLIFRHTFSHYHLDILPVFIQVKTRPTRIMDSEHQIWYKLDGSQKIGLPAPVKKILGSGYKHDTHD